MFIAQVQLVATIKFKIKNKKKRRKTHEERNKLHRLKADCTTNS